MSRANRVVLPSALRPGDQVGIVATAMPLAARYRERYRAGVLALERHFGVTVQEAGNLNLDDDFVSGSVEERAEALVRFLSAPEIRAVFFTIGGFNSGELLSHIDFESLTGDPKVVCGYSDCTSLLLGLHARAGWCTFYGPAVMTQFGEYPEPHPFTMESLTRAIVSGARGEILDPDGWTDEFLDWGTDAWKSRPRQLRRPAAREIWREGQGRGVLWGGNVETLNFSIGTPYLAIPERIVLFIEAVAQEAYLPRIRRALTHLEQAGILERTVALLIGRSPDASPVGAWDLRSIILERVAAYGFPVIGQLPFGHTDPMVTLPIGVEASVTAAGGRSEIVVEPSVVPGHDRKEN